MSSYFNFHLTLTATNIVHVCLIFCLLTIWLPHRHCSQEISSMRMVNWSFSISPLHPQQHCLGSSRRQMAPQQVWEEMLMKIIMKLNEEMFYWGEKDGVKSGQALQCLGLAGKEKERDGLELWGKGQQREAVIRGRWMLPLPKARREQEEPLGNKPSRPLSSRSLSSCWCPNGPQAARIKGAWCCSC